MSAAAAICAGMESVDGLDGAAGAGAACGGVCGCGVVGCADVECLQAEADRLCASFVSRMQSVVAAASSSSSSEEQRMVAPPVQGGASVSCSSDVVSDRGGSRSSGLPKRRRSAATQYSATRQRATKRQNSVGRQRSWQPRTPPSPASPSSTSSSSTLSSSDCSLVSSSTVSPSTASTASTASSASSSASSASAVKERRSKLPLRAVYALRSFFTANVSHPYPTDEQKAELARQCGLTTRQVTNWFTNTRRRFLVPFLNKIARATAADGQLPQPTQHTQHSQPQLHADSASPPPLVVPRPQLHPTSSAEWLPWAAGSEWSAEDVSSSSSTSSMG